MISEDFTIRVRASEDCIAMGRVNLRIWSIPNSRMDPKTKCRLACRRFITVFSGESKFEGQLLPTWLAGRIRSCHKRWRNSVFGTKHF